MRVRRGRRARDQGAVESARPWAKRLGGKGNEGRGSKSAVHAQQEVRRNLDSEKEAEGFNAVRDTAAVIDDEDQEARYHNYEPKKLHNCGAPTHPDPAVETRTLSQATPPDVWYTHRLADACQKGTLSSLQIETIVYANQRWTQRFDDCHNTRLGFFLGDGAGLGKGRQIGGLLYEHFRGTGSRAVWLSVSPDLKLDAMRDINDLELDDKLVIHPENGQLPPLGRALDSTCGDGVLFMTYATLIMARAKLSDLARPEELAVENSRLKQLVDWLSKDAAPCIVLDECHKAKNAMSDDVSKQSKTARTVIALQRLLPNAKVLYCSATGVSAVSHLAYMERLGNFGFENNKELIKSLRKAGLGALEAFSMGLKATGAYVARTLSYEGAEFQVREVSMTSVHKVMYDRAAEFWQLLTSVASVMARAGLCKTPSSMGSPLQRQMWSSHQRFFRQLLLSLKVPALVRDAIEAVHEKGHAVVIGLQSTGEASITQAMNESDHDNDDSFVSAPRQMIVNFITNHMPLSTSPNTKQGSGLSEEQARTLYYQVKTVVDEWRNIQPASQATQQQAQRGKRREGQQRHAHVTDVGEDVQIAAEKSFEQAQQDKLEHAKKIGNYVDLADVVTEEKAKDIDRQFEQNKQQAQELAEKRRREETERTQKEREEILSLRKQYDGTANAPSPAQVGEEREANGVDDGDVIVLDGGDDDATKAGSSQCVDVTTPRGLLVDRELQSEADGAGRVKTFDEQHLCTSGSGSARRLDQASVTEMLTPLSSDTAPCALCQRNARGCTNKLCDVCDSAWHLECLGPKAPPQDAAEWKCPLCTGENTRNGIGASANGSEPPQEEDQAAALEEKLGDFTGRKEGATAEARPEREKQNAKKTKQAIDEACSSEDVYADDHEVLEQDVSDAEGGKSSLTNAKAAKPARKRSGGPARGKLPGGKKQKREERDEDEGEAMGANAGDRWLRKVRDLLLEGANALELPPNPLDHAIDMLGGEDRVAEMTGRDVHFVRKSDGDVALEQRRQGTPRNLVNIEEREDFMQGRKLIAIISEAASTGISLHADRRFSNTRRRMHLVAELPWSADKAIQQCGRSHRSNQRQPPSYKIMVTGVGGERRFASAAAARLQSLGAILSGDRHAAGVGNQLKNFDVDTRYGSKAMSQLYTVLSDPRKSVPYSIPLPEVDKEKSRRQRRTFHEFAADNMSAVELASKDSHGGKIQKPHLKNMSVSRFLNRILGLPVNDQSLLFQFFQEILEGIVRETKSKGQYDSGITTLRESSITVESEEEVHEDKPTGAKTNIITIRVDRGISFEEAQKALESVRDAGHADENTGFWEFRESNHAQLGINRAILVTPILGSSRAVFYRVRRPNNARVPSQYKKEDLHNNYVKVANDREDALKEKWDTLYEHYLTGCVHGKQCSRRSAGDACNIGRRIMHEHVLSGAILPVYKIVTDVLGMKANAASVEPEETTRRNQNVTVVSTETTDDQRRKIVGLYLPSSEAAQDLREAIESKTTSTG